MKHLLLTALCGGFVLLAAPTVQAQTDSTRTVKPQLNTAPPAAPKPAPQPQQPQPQHQVPVPAPTEQYPQPSKDSPSGLELPPQPKAAEAPKSKYFLYSNFGLGFSSNPYEGSQFSLSLAPAIGYRVTERLAVGPGISYSFNNYSFPDYAVQQGYPNSVQLHNIGVKAFAQFIVFREFFLHGEYEVTRAEQLYQDNSSTQVKLFTAKKTISTPLLGVGYRQQFGNRAAGDISVLYNFNDGLDDIYGQPVIRFSFLFDLK
ncbi:hypothetical protein [Hymenobacter sp. BT730]|uniref:hypothetical protein n=1 Tax=Hymenobacter sp. BT730 TaxID=3063332 RepID=UPI0026E078B6|nr:hypothetical protein [Hymenobacter sp. BT730]